MDLIRILKQAFARALLMPLILPLVQNRNLIYTKIMKTKILVPITSISSVSIAQTTVANKPNKRQHHKYNCPFVAL
jgi:hypothetical protein